MSETDERLPRGPKGDKGDKGEGISPQRRRAVFYLIVVTLLLAGANLLFTAHYVNSTVAASQKAAAATQKAATADALVTALCQAGNAARGETVDLWTFIIRLSKPPKTADQRRVLAEFEHHLRAKFAPQPCALPRPR